MLACKDFLFGSGDGTSSRRRVVLLTSYGRSGKDTLLPASDTVAWAYPPIYSADEKRAWQCGYDGAGSVFTVFGMTDGKLQISKIAVKTNTSGRSIQEQSLVSVRSRYKTKVVKDGFHFKPDVIVDANAFKSANEEAADLNARPFPMLVKDLEKLTSKALVSLFPCLAQFKYDGVRCIIDLDSDGNARFSSRARNSLQHLAPIFASEAERILSKLLLPECFIDCELVVVDDEGREDFQETVSAAKTFAKGLTETALSHLMLKCFDFYHPTLPFQERLKVLEAAIREAATERISLVTAKRFDKIEDVKRFHDASIELGHEGLVLRAMDSLYEPKKRPNTIVKMKEFADEEGVITDVISGEGKEANAAILIVKVEGVDAAVRMHPMGSLETREKWLLERTKIIGKLVTFKCAKERTKEGVPRFPVAKAIRDYE
jgi:ATP-dependent DNA ligase